MSPYHQGNCPMDLSTHTMIHRWHSIESLFQLHLLQIQWLSFPGTRVCVCRHIPYLRWATLKNKCMVHGPWSKKPWWPPIWNWSTDSRIPWIGWKTNHSRQCHFCWNLTADDIENVGWRPHAAERLTILVNGDDLQGSYTVIWIHLRFTGQCRYRDN